MGCRSKAAFRYHDIAVKIRSRRFGASPSIAKSARSVSGPPTMRHGPSYRQADELTQGASPIAVREDRQRLELTRARSTNEHE